MNDPSASRGARNNNPGNLNYIADHKRAWNGQVGLGDEWLPEGSRRFGRYENATLGIRALAGQLVVNQARHGCDTVRKQVLRWAPAADNNDVDAYTKALAATMNVHPDARLDFRAYRHARPAVEGIIIHECGGNPYAAAEIDAGLAAYGITPQSEHPQVATVADAARTDTGKAALGLGGAGVAAIVAQSAPAIQALGALTPVVALTLLAVAVGAVLLWRVRRP